MKSPLASLLCLAALTVGGPATLLAADSSASPAPSPRAAHQVVFELTSSDPETWNALLNNVENVRKAFGAASTSVEVVVHGPALAFLKTTNAASQDRIQTLASAGVVFAACENTMKRQKVSKDQLMPAATTVDSGVAEIIRKQESGWSYIRTGG